MSNEQIINAWKNGKKLGKSLIKLNTNGVDIFSYRLKIGTTDEKKNKILFIYTAQTNNYYSDTTSRHCNLIRRKGVDKVYEMSENQYNECKLKYKEVVKIIYDNTYLPKELCLLVGDYII
jgi:hypothetical protein